MRKLSILIMTMYFISVTLVSICLADLESCTADMRGVWEVVYGENSIATGNSALVTDYTGEKRCDVQEYIGPYRVQFNQSLACIAGEVVSHPDCPFDVSCQAGQIINCRPGFKPAVLKSCAVHKRICTSTPGTESDPNKNRGTQCRTRGSD